MMTYFLLFCLLLSHTEAKTISHPPAAPSPHHFPPLESSPKDSLLPRHCPHPLHHFWLVYTWPKGFCSNHLINCPTPNILQDKLTIHGWWPVDRKDKTLKYKQRVGSIKDVFEDKALYNDMIKHWRNLKARRGDRRQQIAFWNHEWARHGICSGLEPRQYFEEALALKEKIDIFQALSDGGIEPGAAHPRNSFDVALESVLPRKSFAMICGDDKNGNITLTEIRVCTSYTHAIECSQLERLRDNCGSSNINL